MTPRSVLSEQPEGEPPSRPGRKLGPVAPEVGVAHRAWLEPVRNCFLASGMTVGDLSERTNYAKSKISELLRGTGLYPRWEITCSVLVELGIPTPPVLRLWATAAVEANKRRDWIDAQKAVARKAAVDPLPDLPPVDHRGFTQLNGRRYTLYARVFLADAEQAEQVVTETFDILWLRWGEALASPDIRRYGWRVLRQSVMARTPCTGDGRPDLRAAGFSTEVLRRTPPEGQLAQIEESMRLFHAVGALPDQQLDVAVLKHLRGLADDAVADVLGVPLASVLHADRYARRRLAHILDQQHPGGTQ